MILETARLFKEIREHVPIDCRVLITEWCDWQGITIGIKIVLRAKIKNKWRELQRNFNFTEIENIRMSKTAFQKHLIKKFCKDFVADLRLLGYYD